MFASSFIGIMKTFDLAAALLEELPLPITVRTHFEHVGNAAGMIGYDK